MLLRSPKVPASLNAERLTLAHRSMAGRSIVSEMSGLGNCELVNMTTGRLARAGSAGNLGDRVRHGNPMRPRLNALLLALPFALANTVLAPAAQAQEATALTIE